METTQMRRSHLIDNQKGVLQVITRIKLSKRGVRFYSISL